jgi:hypothetical protein
MAEKTGKAGVEEQRLGTAGSRHMAAPVFVLLELDIAPAHALQQRQAALAAIPLELIFDGTYRR